MRSTYNVTVVAEDALLVPYRAEHVPTYHAWLLEPELQALTGTEPPASEAETAARQRSWHEDPASLAFIILDPREPDTAGTGAHGGGMAGDVNLFLNDDSDSALAELNVMIAEPRSRRRGLARGAVRAAMAYGAALLSLRRFRAVVDDANGPSRALFEALGFRIASHSEVFQQTTYEWTLPENQNQNQNQDQDQDQDREIPAGAPGAAVAEAAGAGAGAWAGSGTGAGAPREAAACGPEAPPRMGRHAASGGLPAFELRPYDAEAPAES